jgi:pimeloyl-ACP methyl ester carboxylesterase
VAQEQVHVIGTSAAAPADVWAIVRDFCGHWHPAVASICAERGVHGSLIRAFTCNGESTLYREQLTYLSDSDRTLGYTHLQGIEGVDHYDARLTVSADADGGSVINWTADLIAPAMRAAEIASGTTAIFEMGIAALSGMVGAPLAAEVLPDPVDVTTVTIDGLPRLVLTASPELGQDTLCLFLHGIGGGRGNWVEQVQLAGRVMRAAALDFRGYGDSALGPRQSTVDAYCADILRVCQTLGAKRLVLCGLSFGSWIATSFAMRYPDLLAGLVLSGGCTGMSEASPEEREAFRVSREVPLNAGQVPADFAPAVIKVLAGPGASDAVKAQLQASMAAIPVATYRDALICFTNPPERFDFARLTMPVLLMTGAYDRLAPPAEIRSVAGRIWDNAARPDVRFEVIADAGHVCNLERPDEYSRLLLQFLRRLPRPNCHD